MDLSKRGHLTPSEKIIISRYLQIHVIEAIAKSVHDMQGRLMFQGGTAISTVHQSPRWSEDLDFMVNPDMSLELDAVRSAIEEQAAERILDLTPGATFQLIDKGKVRGKVREADPGTVMSWTGRWQHPARIGVVKMKAEFYIAEPEAAARYHTRMARPMALEVESAEAIPAATLDMIWADKIMAMSARPVMKWRDVYDMGFIMERLGEASDDLLFERLKVSCRSYRSDMGAIHAGLGRDHVAGIETQREEFVTDMRSWLPGQSYEEALESGQLNGYHQCCVEQIARARKIITDRIPEIAVVNDEDYSCGFGY